MGQRDDVGRAERQCDLLGVGRCASRRRWIAAQRCDRRYRRVSGRQPDWLAELTRQPVGLFGGGDRDVPVGQAHGQNRLRRQKARQTTKPSFRSGVVQRDRAELQTVVEGADDHAGRAQVPGGLGADHAALRGVT